MRKNELKKLIGIDKFTIDQLVAYQPYTVEQIREGGQKHRFVAHRYIAMTWQHLSGWTMQEVADFWKTHPQHVVIAEKEVLSALKGRKRGYLRDEVIELINRVKG